MPTHVSLYQEVFQRMVEVTRPEKLRRTAVQRLALLVTGLLAARSCVLSQVAADLLALDLTHATQAESLQRRLRRTLTDQRLSAARCYEPILAEVIDWDALRAQKQPVILIVDESSCTDRIHLFRVSLAYWGGALPLAWASWEQNVAQPEQAYWHQVDDVLARVKAVVPPDVSVLVLADRAFDIPPFVDRIAAFGWHWIVRAKAASDLRFRDRFGQEADLAGLVRFHLPGPNRRWKIRGSLFKKAGWRVASVVAVWAASCDEPLVVLTDLPPSWDVIAIYRRRFWTEPGFRNDKSHGWQWEESHVVSLERHQVLLVAFAWATLLTLCLGVTAARERLSALAHRPCRQRPHDHGSRRPQHARSSIFTLGLQRIRCYLYRTLAAVISWILPDPAAPSWNDHWFARQFHLYLFETVRP